ncbi:hypothetical protein O181_065949 [Austropuccinia psidii MF-1]|uniref:Uncharacterized protein n=1 Tax=Austropuccinia psidii MF-1 TaxID=1389203 RepID=A0A9Q3ESH5_9BASI|nr:hypothetical protein [Austropuccinia psidii MF-1]
MDEALLLHQILKDLFQWTLENKRFNLASHWAELVASFQKICLREIPFKDLMEITKGWNPTRQFRLLEERSTRIRENQATIQAIEEQLNQTGPYLIPSGSQGVEQTRSPVASYHSGTNRSAQEPEIFLNNSRISNPTNQNITPTQTEHNVVTPESNLNSDKLWLPMSQFEVQTQEKIDDFKRLNKRSKRNAIIQEATIKAIQESCAQLSKASEEINKRMNQVFEEQHHCKRDRDFMYQDIKKLFNVYQNMKHKPQGHALDDPYHQGDIKLDVLLGNKERSPSQYQDGNDMSYYEKEALKQLPETSSWPKFSGTGEYDHIQLIDYIAGLFIDVPRIPDYWIITRLNIAFKGHASI